MASTLGKTYIPTVFLLEGEETLLLVLGERSRLPSRDKTRRKLIYVLLVLSSGPFEHSAISLSLCLSASLSNHTS